jgi:hypothetical protein
MEPYIKMVTISKTSMHFIAQNFLYSLSLSLSLSKSIIDLTIESFPPTPSGPMSLQQSIFVFARTHHLV